MQPIRSSEFEQAQAIAIRIARSRAQIPHQGHTRLQGEDDRGEVENGSGIDRHIQARELAAHLRPRPGEGQPVEEQRVGAQLEVEDAQGAVRAWLVAGQKEGVPGLVHQGCPHRQTQGGGLLQRAAADDPVVDRAQQEAIAAAAAHEPVAAETFCVEQLVAAIAAIQRRTHAHEEAIVPGRSQGGHVSQSDA